MNEVQPLSVSEIQSQELEFDARFEQAQSKAWEDFVEKLEDLLGEYCSLFDMNKKELVDKYFQEMGE
jgi:hypothetical protein